MAVSGRRLHQGARGRHIVAMYACPHCGSTRTFLAFKDGFLIQVLEDHEDVEGLESVKELLCQDCNEWFSNPTLGEGAHRRLTGELVTITGLRSKGTIKVVATGMKMPFHYDTYQEEVADMLRNTDPAAVQALKTFSAHPDHTLALRCKEDGNANTWVYRIDRKRLWKRLGL